MSFPRRWVALLALAFWALPSQARAASDHKNLLNKLDPKAKLDDCSCNYFTGDPVQPTKVRRFSSDPVCGISGQDLYFSCDDAYNVMTAQCYCMRRGASNAGILTDRIERYGESGDCRYLGPLTAPNPGDSFPLLDCDAVDTAKALPKSRCFCLQPTDSPYQPYQLRRYNWATECVAAHYSQDDDDPSPADLPACVDAMDVMNRCFCKGDSGVEQYASDPSCAGMKYAALERKDGKGPILDLPACGQTQQAPVKRNKGPE